MSISGGMPCAVERAVAVGATALQVFCKSSNQWRARPFGPGEPAAFREAVDRAGLTGAVLSHCNYLINLASPDDELWERSKSAFAEELSRCGELGIPAVVLHPGAHVGSGVDAGLARVVAALDDVLGRGGPPGTAVRVLLEITAGQGSALGSTFEELATVIARVRTSDRIGVCFDTCHALAAGYEFRDASSSREMWSRFDRTVGLARLGGFHLNDSVHDLGSRKDRHAHIGHGRVGLEAFRLILNDPRFEGLPMVLETEKGDDLAEDRVNLTVLRSLVSQ